MDENQRIRFLIYDGMVAQGVNPLIAAPIAQQIGTTLKRNDTDAPLYVTEIADSAGQVHDTVTSKPGIGKITAGPFDIAALRAIARQQIAEERTVDDRLQDSGTAV